MQTSPGLEFGRSSLVVLKFWSPLKTRSRSTNFALKKIPQANQKLDILLVGGLE